ncbi:hypothetical protein ACIF9R_09455 [Streptomyces sp. NPDC086080]|uniref:hypothetical protein n=1 Tax=Streptomyces sp. NPDC086080 TaxID=3365748 RepID=UPI0037D3062F
MTADDEREAALYDEWALRELLERAVPRLPAPDSRMRRVRERVLRRRRRRTVTVAAACAAVTAVLAGATVLGGALRPGQEAGPGSELVPPAASPSRERLVHAELAGLTLDLPPGWYGLAVPEAPTAKRQAVAFAASQPVDGSLECAHHRYEICPPLDRLSASGGSLLVLHLQRTSGLDGTQLDELCRDLGATHRHLGLIKVPGQDAVIDATVCVGGGPEVVERQAELVRRMLEDLRFDKYATRPPTSAGPPSTSAGPPSTSAGPPAARD